MERPIGPQDERSLLLLNRSARRDIPPLSMTVPPKPPEKPQKFGDLNVAHYEREIKHLNELNQRLSKIVREYQKILGLKPPELDESRVINKQDLKGVKELHDYPMLLNSAYYLSPLLLAYDAHLFNLEEEMKKMKADSDTLRDMNRKLMDENEMLGGQVEKQNLELQKALTLRGEETAVSLRSEQEQQFEDRLNLLSEENQVLFEQVEGYKVQFEALSRTYDDKMREMSDKIGKFDELQQEYDSAIQKLQEAVNQNDFLQKKVGDYAANAGVIESALQARDGEIKRLMSELQTHKEYHIFYKGEFTDMERKRNDEVKRLSEELKELTDQNSEKAQRINELEESRKISEGHIKSLELELAAARQDVATLMKVSDDFQQKFDLLTDKEAELNEKHKEYNLKIQELNIEKDKCSLGEKKLQRELDKLADEHREELRVRSERYEKMLKSSKNAYEERLQSKEDEFHRIKMENEELSERVKFLEDQLKESNERVDKLFKSESERRDLMT